MIRKQITEIIQLDQTEKTQSFEDFIKWITQEYEDLQKKYKDIKVKKHRFYDKDIVVSFAGRRTETAEELRQRKRDKERDEYYEKLREKEEQEKIEKQTKDEKILLEKLKQKYEKK